MRSLAYSNWHRHAFNDYAKMIDIDSVEICPNCDRLVALIEVARDDLSNPAPRKTATYTNNAADDIRTGIPALTVLYTLGDGAICNGTGPCDRPDCHHGIVWMRVRRHFPAYGWNDDDFRGMHPREYAKMLEWIHFKHLEVCRLAYRCLRVRAVP
jgi:hypothetical protein